MTEVIGQIGASVIADIIDGLLKKKKDQKTITGPSNGGLLTYPQPQITDTIDWENKMIKNGNYLNSWGGSYYSNSVWGPGLAGLHEGSGIPDPFFLTFFQ